MCACRDKRIVLASASPRRKALLEQIGIEFEIRPACINEEELFDTDPIRNAVELAIRKAKAVAKDEPEIVIGADTIVLIDSKVFGKPADRSDAFQMLSELSGKTHQVVTAVAIIDTEKRIEESWFEVTNVKFRRLDPDEIEEYLDSGEYVDKAGAYGIQGRAAAFVDKIEGCYFNIVGLPLSRLFQRIRKLKCLGGKI